MVIIDTSAWIELFRDDGDIAYKLGVTGLVNALEGSICGPVEMEIFGGAKKHELKTLNPWFAITPYRTNDQKVWRKAANNFSKLRSKGYTLPWNDILIATIALERDDAVYANDKHFPVMEKVLGLRLYTPGLNGKFNPDY